MFSAAPLETGQVAAGGQAHQAAPSSPDSLYSAPWLLSPSPPRENPISAAQGSMADEAPEVPHSLFPPVAAAAVNAVRQQVWCEVQGRRCPTAAAPAGAAALPAKRRSAALQAVVVPDRQPHAEGPSSPAVLKELEWLDDTEGQWLSELSPGASVFSSLPSPAIALGSHPPQQAPFGSPAPAESIASFSLAAGSRRAGAAGRSDWPAPQGQQLSPMLSSAAAGRAPVAAAAGSSQQQQQTGDGRAQPAGDHTPGQQLPLSPVSHNAGSTRWVAASSSSPACNPGPSRTATSFQFTPPNQQMHLAGSLPRPAALPDTATPISRLSGHQQQQSPAVVLPVAASGLQRQRSVGPNLREGLLRRASSLLAATDAAALESPRRRSAAVLTTDSPPTFESEASQQLRHQQAAAAEVRRQEQQARQAAAHAALQEELSSPGSPVESPRSSWRRGGRLMLAASPAAPSMQCGRLEAEGQLASTSSAVGEPSGTAASPAVTASPRQPWHLDSPGGEVGTCIPCNRNCGHLVVEIVCCHFRVL